MDFTSIVPVCLLIFLINLPFGYWRGMTGKFSLQWFLAIHLPVPMVVALRLMFGLGFKLVTIPILVGSYFFGQMVGSRFSPRLSIDSEVETHPPRDP